MLYDSFNNPLISKQSQMAAGDYQSSFRTYWFSYINQLPAFTFQTVRYMLCEPTIILGLAMREAPICNAEFGYIGEGSKWIHGVRSKNKNVAKFVYKLLQRVWTNEVHRMISCQLWGWAGGEVVWKVKHDDDFNAKMLCFDSLDQAMAEDITTVRHRDLGMVGVAIRNCQTKDGKSLRLEIPGKGWFTSHKPLPGNDYGLSVLRGSYSPFADKWFDGGALDVVRLYMHADAYSGKRIGYPRGSTPVEGRGQVPNHVLAREMAENAKSGEVICYPLEYDENNNPKWKIEDSKSSGNADHILQYPKECDIGMMRGMEIPDEVLITEMTGAWQGKKVPLIAFFHGLQRLGNSILSDCIYQIAEPAVYRNFGSAIDFETSLLPFDVQALMLEQSNYSDQGSGGMLGGGGMFGGEGGGGGFGGGMRMSTEEVNKDIGKRRLSASRSQVPFDVEVSEKEAADMSPSRLARMARMAIDASLMSRGMDPYYDGDLCDEIYDRVNVHNDKVDGKSKRFFVNEKASG